MKVETFAEILGVDFYTGVPDSLLKPLCNYLMDTCGIDYKHHIIAANEGNCAAIAAGYHISTNKIPAVYMQNSGEGNIINPVASLLNCRVYSIPMIFIIGWRGEPGIYDEPQHIYQGEVTLRLLEVMDIQYFVVDKNLEEHELKRQMNKFSEILFTGKDVAFVIKKGALSYDRNVEYRNEYILNREEIIKHIVDVSGDDPIVATTGKASRELFEIREREKTGHKRDFLTVGSMGHSSSIALGIALQKPEKRIWCIDGDGAMLMHMGAMAVIGAACPNNFIHIIINNESHETVGGMPTAAKTADIASIASACGYKYSVCVDNMDDLDKELNKVLYMNSLCAIEVKCAIGARADLGRPTTSAEDNKREFMEFLRSEKR